MAIGPFLIVASLDEIVVLYILEKTSEREREKRKGMNIKNNRKDESRFDSARSYTGEHQTSWLDLLLQILLLAMVWNGTAQDQTNKRTHTCSTDKKMREFSYAVHSGQLWTKLHNRVQVAFLWFACFMLMNLVLAASISSLNVKFFFPPFFLYSVCTHWHACNLISTVRNAHLQLVLSISLNSVVWVGSCVCV